MIPVIANGESVHAAASSKSDVKGLFERQRQNRWRVAQSSARDRVAKLRKLRDAILARREELSQAIFDDFRKNPTETDLTELFPTIAELNHTIRHVGRWMRPRRVGTPLALKGTSSQVRYEARGLVLVLSPWNYPFNLAVNPVVAAIAAGNCVILKPSAKVPHTARFLKRLFDDVFDPAEAAVVLGDHTVADDLLELPFDHVFFTGSPKIGKKVMTAAARHLATVTLELGGKSPVVIDASADIAKAASRVMWAKLINCGQTCVAPDYVLVHESRAAELIAECKKVLAARFGKDEEEIKAGTSLARLVSEGSARHLKTLIDATVAKGAILETGGTIDEQTRYLSPTLLSGVTQDSPIMQEEIFGPVLPIITFRSLEEACVSIQQRDKPLALYVFAQDGAAVEEVLRGTSAGGTCVNNLIIHLANPDLPFGGVGASGMGNYHGFFGFRNLSHERAVLRQGFPDVLRFFYPPYTDSVRKLTSKLLRFCT